jgi:hypothetical protein
VIEQDLTTLTAEGVAAKADLKAALATIKADEKTIKAEVISTKPSKAQKAVVAALGTAETAATNTYKNTITKILNSGKSAGGKLESALKSLKKKPTSLVLRAKVEADLTALENVFSDTVVTTVETDASTTVTSVDGDLDAVATAVPSAQTDVNTAETDLATDLGTLSGQATLIQSEIATLALDIG